MLSFFSYYSLITYYIVYYNLYSFFYKINFSLLNIYFNFFIIFFFMNLFFFLNYKYIYIYTIIVIFTSELFLSNYFIPVNLLVGYNNIHPFLFYIGFILLCFSLNFFFIKNIFIYTLLLLAFILGGKWGLGNFIWGYFWVNDFIEIIILLLIIVIIIFYHIILNNINFLLLFCYAYYLVIFINLLRFGFIFSRHTFLNIDLTNNFFIYLVNLYFINLFYIIFFIVLYYILHSIVYYILLLTLLYIISFNKFYKNLNILFHYFFYFLVICWIKYRSNNLMIFYLYNYSIMSLYYFDIYTYYNFIIKFNYFSLVNLNIFNHFIYFLKNFYSLIIFSYNYFCYCVIFLLIYVFVDFV